MINRVFKPNYLFILQSKLICLTRIQKVLSGIYISHAFVIYLGYTNQNLMLYWLVSCNYLRMFCLHVGFKVTNSGKK